ncbi:MAG: hypothetical protein Q8930_13010 [Bacillota bacterium]|nr:hypothetical protein [Bacillota bacterium]
MKISDAKKCIRELYLNASCVTALVSERGVGKTSAYQQVARELGIDYMGLYAAALEGPDFMGLPDKDREKGLTRYLAPQFLPTVEAVREGIFKHKGLLVLEEINRVPSDTISVLYPLLLENRINGHKLAEGWKIGVTMNPDTMNYAVNSLDDAMLDRFVTIEVNPNIDDYIEYSLDNGPNDLVLNYLSAIPDMLLAVKGRADSTAGNKAPTPRGWTRVQELLNNCRLENRLMLELVSGIIGPEAAASFFGYMRNQDIAIPSADKILNDYPSVRADIEGILEKGRIDILNVIIRRIVKVIALDKVHLANADAFVKSLPDELKILFFKTLIVKRSEDFQTLTDEMTTFEPMADKIIELMK